MNLFLPNDRQFHWKDGQLYCEQISLQKLAEEFGTPLYVYSMSAIKEAFAAFQDALQGTPHLVCYALKANSNLAVINLLGKLGAGFDIVSGGELARVIAAGCDPHKVIFSGVGKTVAEIEQALTVGIKCFNVESPAELDRIIEIATRLKKRAPISLRVNPDVDAKTHPYISTGLKSNKFGVAYKDAVALYKYAAQHSDVLEITGIDCHIGSQITTISPYADACDKILDLVDQLKANGIHLRHIDFGGGLGIRYEEDEQAPAPADLVNVLKTKLAERQYSDLEMIFEEGRYMVGNSGALLTEVQYLKEGEEKNFCIVDAAMNDMIRPTLYQAWMQIVPTSLRQGQDEVFDIVGPVCETGDWIGKQRSLCVKQGDFLAMLSAGAYGMSMSSHYNTRLKPAEVMIDGDKVHVIRKRENMEKLFSSEVIIP